MKKFLWALVPMTLLMAGCEDPCKKGVALRHDITTLETVVNGTIVQPSTLDNTCSAVRQNWDETLLGGARFARKVARDHFYSVEHRCLRTHYEYRCDYVEPPAPGYPGSPDHGRGPGMPPYYGCRSYRVCDEYKTIEHKKDGYDQSFAAANALDLIRLDLDGACAAHAGGDTVSALANLLEAKLQFDSAADNTDYVLNKAGCFEPGRRGE